MIDFEYSGSGDTSKIQEDIKTLEEIRERVGDDSIIMYLGKEMKNNQNFNPTQKKYDSDSDNESLESTKRNLFD